MVLADANIGRKLSMSAQHLTGVPARQFISMIAATRAKILARGNSTVGDFFRLPAPGFRPWASCGAAVQLAAERRLGEMLVKAKAAGQVAEGRRWSKKNPPAPGGFSRVTLKDAGTVKAGQGGQGGQGTFRRVSLAKDRAKHSRICSALLGDPISFRPWLC